MQTLSLVKLAGTDYANAATISGVYPSNGGTFSISGGSVFLQVQTGTTGQFQWGDELPFDPGIGFVLPAGATGIRFRNQSASSAATITASIAAIGNVVPVGGSATQVTTLTSGVLTGRVNADGTVAAGTGFSVVHSGTGLYTVTFTTQFSSAPVVVGNTIGVTADILELNPEPTTTGFVAKTIVLNSGSGAQANSIFNFVCYPMS